MNTSTCDYPLATDITFDFPISTCETNLITYSFICSLIIIFKTLTNLKRFYRLFTHRQGFFKNKITSLMRFQFSLFYTLIILLGFILLGLGITNVVNGWSYAGFSLGFLFATLVSFFQLFEVIRFNQRIMPKEIQNVKGYNHLTHLNLFGKILVGAQLISLTAGSITFVILSPKFPEYYLIFGQIGFASFGVVIFITLSGISYQLFRCYYFLKTYKGSDVREKSSKLQRIYRRRTLFTFSFAIIWLTYFSLLSSRIIPWNFYTIMGVCGIVESTADLMSQFAFRMKKKKMNTSSKNNELLQRKEGDVEPLSTSNTPKEDQENSSEAQKDDIPRTNRPFKLYGVKRKPLTILSRLVEGSYEGSTIQPSNQ